MVLTDLAMPEVNGLELAMRVREIRDGTPLVLMSGFYSRTEEAGMASAGVLHRLHKPLTYASVGHVMAAAVQLGRPRRSGGDDRTHVRRDS